MVFFLGSQTRGFSQKSKNTKKHTFFLRKKTIFNDPSDWLCFFSSENVFPLLSGAFFSVFFIFFYFFKNPFLSKSFFSKNSFLWKSEKTLNPGIGPTLKKKLREKNNLLANQMSQKTRFLKFLKNTFFTKFTFFKKTTF